MTIISFQTLAHQVEEIGDNAEKSSCPQGEATESISECATPKCSSYSSFSHCERLHSTSSLPLELEENCSREVSPPLQSSEQSGSGREWNYKGHGTIQTMNNQLEWTSQCCPRMDNHCWNRTQFTCSRAQDVLRLSRKMLCSIFSFELIFTCSIIHLEQNLPIQTRPSKVLQVFQTEGKKKKQRKTKKQRTDCKSVWSDIAWDNKKANFLTLQTQFLSLKCYYIYLWMCFICAHFVRMAAELCRVQENS